jgi:DivIVA domain-containing protein
MPLPPLSPADVRATVFSRPPLGKRGYSEDEVDQFLDRVEAELIRQHEQIAQLRQQTHAAPPTFAPMPAQAPTDAATKMLAMAQSVADKLTAEATARATLIVADATAAAEAAINTAKVTAAGMVEDATRTHVETVGRMAIDRDALQQQITELGGYEQNLRAELTRYLETQLASLKAAVRSPKGNPA